MLGRGLRQFCWRSVPSAQIRWKLLRFSTAPTRSASHHQLLLAAARLSGAPFGTNVSRGIFDFEISGSRRMATLAEDKHEWNAPRVRETFLEYFKKNGHTFGSALFTHTRLIYHARFASKYTNMLTITSLQFPLPPSCHFQTPRCCSPMRA